jgi:hypothetical protein
MDRLPGRIGRVSFLTDIAVVTIGGEDEAVAFVNARLAENDARPQQLGKTDLEEAGAGGSSTHPARPHVTSRAGAGGSRLRA